MPSSNPSSSFNPWKIIQPSGATGKWSRIKAAETRNAKTRTQPSKPREIGAK